MTDRGPNHSYPRGALGLNSWQRRGPLVRLRRLLYFHRFDHHELAHLSLVQEFDASRDLGEESVIFAAAHVQAGLHRCTALPDDDRSTRNNLPAECFESKPLRI
jgi:hypothetical protein